METNTQPPIKYPALDGLRGAAIILVVLYHNFNFIPYLNYGWLGVDLFFVLSGFLITDILLKSMNGPNYFRNFYARRMLRIFPLYYLSLILLIFILPAFFSFPTDAKFYRDHQWWFWTYLQNWILIFGYDGKANTLNHFWSLAVEEQFYLVWPLIILFLKKPKKLLLFCTICLALVIISRIYIWSVWPGHNWLFLFTRIDGILIGSVLAIVYRISPGFLKKYSTVFILLLALFNFSIYFLRKHQSLPVWSIAGYSTFSSLFALLLYECIQGENKLINSIFSNPILRFLGKYSYGFYIFHWPVFVWIKPYASQLAANWSPNQQGVQLLIVATAATIAGLAVSVISFHIFEKHFLKLKKHFV